MVKAKPATGGNEAKKQIILVIDGRPVRKFYTTIFLQRLNYHVISAKTAEDGLMFMGMTVPLAIIMNIDLPDVSGLELLKRVKKERRTRDVPVIIYTSNRDTAVQRDCEQSGCAAYLRHPATLEELYVAIQKATRKPRRFVRLDTFLDVTLGEDHRASNGRKDYIAAISELGMFVSTDNPPSYGSVHPFTFCLPNAPGWIIRTEGQVVYHRPVSEMKKQPGVGIKFMQIGARDRELIRDFIREKLMEDIAQV